MTRVRIALMLVLALAACGGEEPPTVTQPGGAEPEAPTLLTGDGSDLCLQSGDLPAGYLPLTGSDNTSNAQENVFNDPAVPAGPALVASWLVLPDGGASLEDRTASCSIYLFDTAEVDELYAWYADTYPSRSAPAPTEEAPPAGGPGEDPRLYHFAPNEYSGRESYTYVFRFGNAIVNIDVDAAAGEVSVDDLVTLATAVHARLLAAP